MRLVKPFSILGGIFSDAWMMHDFDYKLPKESKESYFEKECLDHPTMSHCKVYDD
ncbi:MULTISPECIES: hypothetical protein [Prochlorococcus]|uniref:Protein family PM-14 n=1 Tax=Prochlorococcus marinus (strain SARG / CCMP1375 / SS120) TaxID=167539 RepID=Q7VAJ2_PROMA|nr:MULTISPECIES: hypothetical protein [Prochlorococcus]AAQ00514.1 Predicted protein family PM-14 [Prochlorococcus marinus subsp. marinus str. CCMP1375]KGG10316.1 hypothetical protein EV04_1982 [Prochlorococcus marinus str. LG]KGG22597.1 hypothetical protein EV08_0012 [Prochlorococcus marinus str. SS2]KGG24250.1 hypothetical protein EV09_0857 [Prochlorococcus marinus str. SS35]KGG33137.1 hypothetical protein EV10_0770 [Prochlorococcus marinus str. SS51]